MPVDEVGTLINLFTGEKISVNLGWVYAWKKTPDYKYITLKGIPYDTIIGCRFREDAAKYNGFPLLLDLKDKGAKPIIYVSNYYVGKKFLHINCRFVETLKWCEIYETWADRLSKENIKDEFSR